ncbi:MAG: winged helix-turn-helix transcriptional regulator [Nanoarchaeota archaeon]|nr:AsnC family transcriptional regulator [Nanoarchaeota archaeon]
MKLDLRNRQILYELWQDARISSSQIARKIGVSREVVDYRIKRLLEEKYISHFITMVNTDRLGYVSYNIHLQLKNFDEEKLLGMIKYLSNHPFVKWVVSCSGKWDLVFTMMAKNKIHFDELFTDICDKLRDHIADYDILTRIKIYKDLDVVFLKGEIKSSTYWKKKDVPRKVRLDARDLKILGVLSQNGRMHLLDIAKKVDLTPEAVNYRMKKLVSQQIIRNYRAVIDVSKLGYLWYMLMLDVQNITPKKESEIMTFFNDTPNIFYVDKTIGRWNLRVEIITKNHEEFYKILVDIRNHFQDILKSFELLILFKDCYQVSYAPGMIEELKEEKIV